ncbi:ferredoxin [Streptomyces coeruleorubidus]|uniref:ferredoxin n=1 Tax=Streptomyces coeruleorubidus TaxID=116188 RepID=UPI00379319BA
MRITVDHGLCDGLGQCALVAPEVFELNDDERLEVAPDPAPELAAKVTAAARACPVRAISVEGA